MGPDSNRKPTTESASFSGVTARRLPIEGWTLPSWNVLHLTRQIITRGQSGVVRAHVLKPPRSPPTPPTVLKTRGVTEWGHLGDRGAVVQAWRERGGMSPRCVIKQHG